MSTLELLIGTHVEDPASFIPRPPLMKRMCCGRLETGERCDLVLGWVICAPAHDGLITHGFCPPCYEAMLEQAAEELGAEYARELLAPSPLCAPGARLDRVPMPGSEVTSMGGKLGDTSRADGGRSF